MKEFRRPPRQRGAEVEDPPSVLAMFSRERDPQNAYIACPLCGFEYTHIREVFSRLGGDESGGGYPGTAISSYGSGSRRDALVIVFDGECGHAWELVIRQHKGSNYLAYAPVANELFPDQEETTP